MTHPYDPETVVLGVVGRPHGIKGELWLRPHNTHGHSFEGLRELVLAKNGVVTTHAIVSLNSTPDGAIVRLAGIDSREKAAALTLSEIRAPRAVLPPLAPGEFYVDDVIGCRVFHESGRELGLATAAFWNGGQDVMIVKLDGEPAAEELIPLVPHVVVTMDAPGRKIVVAWDVQAGEDGDAEGDVEGD